jgi:ketosteroid isomerase-like protein
MRAAKTFFNWASRPVPGPNEAIDAIYSDAERDGDMAAARAAFVRFTALEAAYDPALVDTYADDGVVVERTIENGAERRVREVPLKRYKALLTQALSVSRKAREVSTHADIKVDRIAPGWVIIRSRRAYTHARAPAPYEVTLRREPDGAWRIVKEVATLIL